MNEKLLEKVLKFQGHLWEITCITDTAITMRHHRRIGKAVVIRQKTAEIIGTFS